MNKRKKPIILQTDLHQSQQSWFHTQVFKVGDTKLRTRICRNAYDFQSYAKVERWNGEEWKEVATRPISELLCKDVGYYEQTLTAEQKGFFEFDAEVLLNLAIAIIA